MNSGATSLEVICGIELSTYFEEHSHPEPIRNCDILGYFLDPHNTFLKNHSRRHAADAAVAAASMTESVRGFLGEANIGIDIDVSEILNQSPSGIVDRGHVGRALREKLKLLGVAETDRFHGAAFRLLQLTPAATTKQFVKMCQKRFPAGPAPHTPPLTTLAAIEVIQAAGGIASLAHPITVFGPATDEAAARTAVAVLGPLKDAGLIALEVRTSRHAHDVEALFFEVARRVGLLPTGGSDFHGTFDETPGEPAISREWTTALRAVHARR